MKKIKLTHGQFALVDDKDFNELNKHKWYAWYNKRTKSYYAVRNITKSNGKQTLQYMHKIIMNAPSNMQVDHTSHDTLNNRKKNLRICMISQNSMNRLPRKNTSSRYKGIIWDKRHKKWASRITINGKRIFLGYFDNEILATKTYNKKWVKDAGDL